MRESKRIRLMKLSERLGKGRIRVKRIPPKVICREVSLGAIDELIDLQLDAKKRKQTLELYYNLVLQNHIADPRTEEELKEYYRGLALDNKLDPIMRVNCVKYFLALKHHLFQERVLKSQRYPCNNYHHSYIYVGGTATRLDFKCKYCGDTMSSTSADYLDAEKRRWAIKNFTGARDADEVVTAEPPQECEHHWINRHKSIVCSKCGEEKVIREWSLGDD